MKVPKITSSVLWPIVVLIIAFGAFYIKPWQTKQAETISVTAQGTADSVPNVGKITATIESKNPNLDLARQENDKKVSQIITKLKELGVEEKDIKTQNLSAGQSYEIQPMMYPVPPRPNTNNFSTTMEITIRNFDTTDKILSTLTQNGLTNLYGPELTVSNEKLEETKSKAREKAVENAKKKASELAKVTDRKIGKAVKISELGDYGYPIPMMAVSGTDLAEKASRIQPGQNEITINLAVDFSLK